MMQLDEMARQASTDVKLAVMDLEAPPIGATAKSERKATAGWAKPLFAMAALFLIAGTSWALLGGNRDVEETQIADVDSNIDGEDSDVVLLTHPDAEFETIAPIHEAFGNDYLASLVFVDQQTGNGYLVSTEVADEPMTAAMAAESATTIQGLPADFDEAQGRVFWVVSDTVVANVVSLTMTMDELLDELENLEFVDGVPGSDSSYSLVGTTLADGPPRGVNGYSVQFGLGSAAKNDFYQLQIYSGSVEAERAMYESVMGVEVAQQEIRNGKTAFVPAISERFESTNGLMFWEESPGVVASLLVDFAEDLAPIAEELTTVEAVGSATVAPLVHPADVDQSVEAMIPLGPDGEDVEVLVFSTDTADVTAEKFAVASIRMERPFTAEDIADGFPGTEVRGLPTASGEDEQGAFVIWLESDDHLVRSGSATMTVEELLAEVQHPGLIEGTVAGDSDFAFVGSTRFLPDAPEASSGLTGFTTTFGVPEIDLEGATFQVSTFVGSLENELAVWSLMASATPTEVEIRPGVTGYLFPSIVEENVLAQLVWEESPGVVAVLHEYYGNFTPIDGQELVGIATQLVAEGTGADPSDGSASATGPMLVPSDGEVTAVTPLPNGDANVIVRSVVTYVYGAANGEISMTVTTADWMNGNEFHQSELASTAVSISGNPVYIGNYGDKAVASYQDRDFGQAVAIASGMTPEELLEVLEAHPDLNRGEVPDGLELLGQSQRFAADGALTLQLDVEGFDVAVTTDAGSYNVSTFDGDAALELAVHRYLDDDAAERVIRDSEASLLSVDDWFDQKLLIWGETAEVVVVLETSSDVSDEQIYAWANELIGQGVDAPENNPTVEIPNERGDARQAGVSPLVPADGEDAIVQELPNPSGNKRVIATWIYYQDGGDGATSDDTPELAVTRVADASPDDLVGEDFSDTILLFDGSVSPYRDGARAVWRDGPDLVIVVGASLTPDELLATIDATPGIGSGEVPEGLERRGGGAKRNPASGSYSFRLDVTGFDAYVGLGVDAYYAVTTYDTDAAEELAAHKYLVPEAVSRDIRNGKPSLHSVDEAGNRQQLIWAESEFVIAILETTPDVSVEQMYTWAENLVPFEASVEDIELTAAEAASPGGQRIEALRQSPANKVLLFRLYDEGRAADIFYEADNGREVCVETIGLDIPVQCFTAEASPPAAYFIRTNADDFDAGERSVLVVMYASDTGSTFPSSDALERSNLTSGMKLIVGALYADDPVLEILDDNGVLLENLSLR